MKTIRLNCFETNSSSTHSLSIGSGIKEFPKPNENNEILIYLGDYGWEIDEYYDLESRMSYVFSYLYDMRDYNSKYQDLYNQLIEYIKENTNADEIRLIGSGYVDHGDEHMDLTFDWLIDFMFNSGSYFTTDNDNH